VVARTESRVDSFDGTWIRGTDVRYDNRDQIEAVTSWVRLTDEWKPEVPDRGPTLPYARDIAKVLINEGQSLADEFGVNYLHEIVPLWVIRFLFHVMFGEKVLDRRHFKDVVTRWLMGEGSLLEVLSDEKYARADTSEVDRIIEQVRTEHADKVDGSEKMANWLTGQVMRLTGGKADPAYVKERMR
jgi:Asp-tRNA(Asn)/Glu-tRNA(Gln) amidotransferase B subunit